MLELGVMLGTGSASGATGGGWRIVVVREKGADRRRAGLRVDDVGGLRDQPAEGLLPPPSTLSERARELVVGVISEPPPCSVLDVSRVLGSPLLAALRGAETQDRGSGTGA